MADVVLNPGSGGSTVHTVTRTGKETQVVGLDLTPAGGSETLMNGSMPITAASLPLPAGAATSAKQPTLGTAGSASADVLSIQGIVSMTAVKTDGSATTQPVSGPLTDTQLRASAVPVSGTVTASGPLTDTQLRASAVPVSNAALAADNAVGLPSVVEVVGGYDGTNVQALATNAAGNLQVGLSAALPAGTAAIGKLAANSGVIIGDVNVNGTATVSGSVTADTELPAAAALADGASNPTAPAVGSFGLLWNGTTWDRAKGDATNGAFVNVKSSVLPTGASTAAKQPALGTAGTPSADVLTIQGATSMTAVKVDGSGVTQPVSGTLVVAGVSSTVTVGGSVSLQAGSSGLAYTPVLYAAQTTTVQTVKGSAGVIAGYMIYNPNATVAYVQIFNTTGAVTLGTTVPLVSLPIPAASGANLFTETGIAFSTGIKLACTTTALGLTAPGAGLDVNIFFK